VALGMGAFLPYNYSIENKKRAREIYAETIYEAIDNIRENGTPAQKNALNSYQLVISTNSDKLTNAFKTVTDKLKDKESYPVTIVEGKDMLGAAIIRRKSDLKCMVSLVNAANWLTIVRRHPLGNIVKDEDRWYCAQEEMSSIFLAGMLFIHRATVMSNDFKKRKHCIGSLSKEFEDLLNRIPSTVPIIKI